MDVLSAEPRPPAANRRSRRPTRAALLFGYFLLGKQEKVTRSQDASGKHRDVSRLLRSAEDTSNNKWIPAFAGTTDGVDRQRVNHPCARAVHSAYGKIQNSAKAEKNAYPMP